MENPHENSIELNPPEVLNNSTNTNGIQMASLEQSEKNISSQISTSIMKDCAMQITASPQPHSQIVNWSPVLHVSTSHPVHPLARKTSFVRKKYYHVVLILTVEQERAIIDLFKQRQWKYVKAGLEQTKDDLQEMCNKMSRNIHETNVLDMVNSPQPITDHSLTFTTNNESKFLVLPRDTGKEVEALYNTNIKVKEERDMDIDEDSVYDYTIGGTSSINDAIIGETSSINNAIIGETSSVNNAIIGETSSVNAAMISNTEMNIRTSTEQDTLGSVKAAHKRVRVRKPRKKAIDKKTHDKVIVKPTNVEGKPFKPSDCPTLSSFLAKPSMTEQNDSISSETLPPTNPVPSASGSGTTEMGIHCECCETIFSNKINFDNHVLNGKCQWVCKFCKKVFVYSNYKASNKDYLYSIFKEKLKQHKKECDCTCKLCGRSFNLSLKVERHMKLCHSKDKEFVCDVCFITFKSETNLYAHKVNKHTGESGIYRCPLCPNEYTVLASVTDHLKYKHLGMKRHERSCSVCGKLCNNTNIKRHEDSHKVKTIKCDQCPAVFNSKINLREHQRRHNKDYSHYCDVCAKGFYTITNLEMHRRIHTGEKPYSCPLCDYTCNAKPNLDKHIKIHGKPSSMVNKK